MERLKKQLSVTGISTATRYALAQTAHLEMVYVKLLWPKLVDVCMETRKQSKTAGEKAKRME